MPEVIFRDTITGMTDTIFMYPDYTINEVIGGALFRFPVKFPKGSYTFLSRGRPIDPSKPTKALRIRNKDVIDVLPAAGHVQDFRTAAKLLNQSKKPLVILGNGISDDPTGGRNLLSTKRVHYDFLESLASANPRLFDSRKKDIRRLLHSLEYRQGDENMLSFMQILSGMDELRDRFLQHLVRACCSSRPHFGHRAFVDFIQILRKTRPALKVFTTNYDNLLEKAYVADYHHLTEWSKRGILTHMLRTPGPTPTIPDYPPQYTVAGQKRDARVIPVVPIHGSVRIAKCPGCARPLETEAAPLGVGICTDCGSEVSPLVLPSAEGKASEEALDSLERCARGSDMMVTAGFSFGDPHIVERLAHSLNPSAGVINLCRTGLPDEFRDGRVFCDLQADLTVSLSYIASLIEPETWQLICRLRRIISAENEDEDI